MENELMHVGVKGMRWGVRRYQNKDGSLTAAGKKRRLEPHEDYREVHDNKSIKQMSNKELQNRNNRLQMERQYQQLTKKQSIGSKAVKAFISTAGTIVAAEAAYKTYKRVGDMALDKIGHLVINSIDIANLR